MEISRRDILIGSLGTTATFALSEKAFALDQTAKLQAQINEAQASNGVVSLAAGIYQVTNLYVSAPIIIMGVPGKTVLQSLNGGNILKLNAVSNAVVSGVVFDSQNLTPAGASSLATAYQMSAFQCADIRVENCIFKNAKTSGAGFDACTGRVVGNQFYNIDQIALRAGTFVGKYQGRVVGNQTITLSGLEISGNHIHQAGNGGIFVLHDGAPNDEDGTIISNNHVEGVLSGSGDGQYGNGIDVFNANNVIIADNRIANCVYGGIRVVSCKHVQVIGNNISRIADSGIFVEFAFESIVVSNNIVEDVSIGIQMSGGDGVLGYTGVCSNNIVRNVGRAFTNPEFSNFIGIDAVSIATNCIGNVVENVAANSHGPGIGILAADWTSSHYHQFEGNIIRNAACGIGIILGAGSMKISILGNTIATASSAFVSMLNQVTYPDGSANTLTPTGGDLTVNNNQLSLVSLVNNTTLE